MQAIQVENLSKTFRVKRKEKGMRGSVKAIFHPQTEEIRAVNGVSFSVPEGRCWHLSAQTAREKARPLRC